MNKIDPLKLQRLVDGELETAQVQELLAAAKSSPDQWQEIAIGFVEDQIWQRSLQASPSEIDQEMATENNPAAPVKSKAAEPLNRDANGFSWLAMAAMLLFSAGLGYFANQFIQTNDEPRPNTVVEHTPELPLSIPQPLLVADNEPNADQHPGFTKADYHFEVPEQESSKFNGPTGKVPLYAVNNQDQLNQLTQQQNEVALSDDLVRQLNGSGFQMQRDIQFISGRMGDGRSFVVPVQTIRFLPGQ